MMLRPFVSAAATFLIATPALAAADLEVQIPAPAATPVYQATSYAVEVDNVGNRRASNVQLTIDLPQTHTSPTVHVMGELSNIDSRCTRSGLQLVCNLGKIRKNRSKTVTFDIELPQADETLELSASATTTSSETITSNNTASDIPAQLNFDVSVDDGDFAHIEHCTGQGLVSFFECALYPSSISSHDIEFHDGGTLSFVAAPPSYTGTWSQPSPDALSMTYYDNGTIVAEFEGYGVSPGCFEGITSFGGAYVAPYRVCL